MAAYLRKLDWTPSVDGVITMPSGHQICLSNQPTKDIDEFVVWHGPILCASRLATARALLPRHSKPTAREQKLLSLNITGGYQTSAPDSPYSNGYASTPTVVVPPHVRDNHPGAVQTLQTHLHLCWFPLPMIHAQQWIYNQAKLCRLDPVLNPRHDPADTHVKIFTDGTCERPKSQNCCRAAWAAMRQTHKDPEDPSFNHVEVLQVSRVQGEQTINPGELAFVVWVSQYYSKQEPVPVLDIYTDSSFVETLVKIIAHKTMDLSRYNVTHFDLAQTLQTTWGPVLFQIHKVKSHCHLSQAVGVDHVYRILGNTVADEAAKLINMQDVPFMQSACHAIAHHSYVQMQALSEIYVCVNSILFISCLKLKEKRIKRKIMNIKTVMPLRKSNRFLLIGFQMARFGPFLESYRLWWHMLVLLVDRLRDVYGLFPPIGVAPSWSSTSENRFGDYTVWINLTIHFTLYAGRCLPIWVRHKDQNHAWPYAFDSEEVAIQKPEVRSLWHQAHITSEPWLNIF